VFYHKKYFDEATEVEVVGMLRNKTRSIKCLYVEWIHMKSQPWDFHLAMLGMEARTVPFVTLLL
jgi:hypothetical protein